MRITVMSLGVALLLALTATADARPRVARSKHFESNKTFGLGLELGAPFGLTGKYFLSEGGDRAIDFGVGDLDDGYIGDRVGLQIYADYLFHPFVIATADSFELPFFIGIGGRYWNFDYGPDSGYAFGIRVPFGMAFDFNNVPIDIFLALVPVLDFVHGYTHDVYGDFDVAVGIRYWFE
jgi:hypothetical protein